jgi:hypothetical protein
MVAAFVYSGRGGDIRRLHEITPEGEAVDVAFQQLKG